MELELEVFLKEREALTEDALETMKSEKIDMAAIIEMGEDNLRQYIPRIGDRLAVMRFCKFNRIPNVSERASLVERIKKSQSHQASDTAKNLTNSKRLSDWKQSGAPNEKATRLISIGWILNGTPIRERNGGGKRSISIAKCAKKKDILEKALDLFFPNGVAVKEYGPLSNYKYDLLDFKEHSFDENFTVGELYKVTGLNLLRFYLSTTLIEDADLSSPDTEVTNKKAKRITRSARNLRREPQGSRSDIKDSVGCPQSEDRLDNRQFELSDSTGDTREAVLNATSLPNDSIYNSIYSLDEFLLLDYTNIEGNSEEHNRPLLQDIKIPKSEIPTEEQVSETHFPNNETENEAQVSELNIANYETPNEAHIISINEAEVSETLSSSKTITLHRGQIFEEMTQEFTTIGNTNTLIDVEIIGTNGTKENAFDGGGVFKDALTEYWNDFYDRICVGSTTKIPEVNYMIDDDKWKAMAKILFTGFKQVNYFPIKLSRPFIEYVIFGRTFTDLIDAYMEFIPLVDADVLKRAIHSFDSVDSSEIIEVFTNLDCKQIPNQENIISVVQHLAHAEIVQKSLYIAQAWSSVLSDKISMDNLNDIFVKCKVTNKSVLRLIQTFELAELDIRKERVLNFLKRYIREGDIDILKRFLRFCTGADIVTCDFINVEFTCQKIPTSHTCNNILVLPVEYDSYRNFRSEFTSILKSDMWSMDIV